MSGRRHSPHQPEKNSAQLRPAQRSCTLPWLALAAVALLVLSEATCCHACNLNNAASLNACLRKILEASRASLKSQIDPLRLPDASGKGVLAWNLTQINVWGLSRYEIKELSVERTALSQLTVKFKVSWPRVRFTSKGKMRLCAVIFGTRQCFPFSGSPQMTLGQPAASLFTRLHLSRRGDHVSVKPSGTRIQFNLPRIKVHLRLRGFLRIVDQMLNFPSRKIATRIAERWWKKNKLSIEDRVRKLLHRLVHKYLSSGLGELLRGF